MCYDIHKDLNPKSFNCLRLRISLIRKIVMAIISQDLFCEMVLSFDCAKFKYSLLDLC